MAGIYSASGWWANQHPGTATRMEAPKNYFIRVMIIYQHFIVLEHNPFLETKTKPCLNYLTLQYELNYITPEGCHELERQTKKQKHKARRILSWNRLKSTQATKHAFVFRIHVKEATLQRSSEQTSTSCSSTRRCPAVKALDFSEAQLLGREARPAAVSQQQDALGENRTLTSWKITKAPAPQYKRLAIIQPFEAIFKRQRNDQKPVKL